MQIYKTINLINEKIYIGQEKFNNPNYYGSGLAIKVAIKKYGKENFKKEIIKEYFTKEDLCEAEKYWIKFYDSFVPKGYNISLSGETITHTIQEKKK